MNNSLNKFIYLHPLSLKQEIISLLFFTALLFIIRYDAFLNIDSHVLGGVAGDGGLYWWLFNHNIENYFKLPFFNTLGFYPYSLSLAWSDNYILPALLSSPFDGFFSRVALYNSNLLLATFLNGYLTYLLAFRLSGYFLPALLSGTALITYPFFSAHLGHPQLQFFFWIPLSLIFFFKYLSEQKLRSAIFCGFCAFLSFLTSVYYTIFLLMLLKLIFAAILIQKPKFLKKYDYLKLIGGFALGVILILPFIYPYLQVKETFGKRFLYEAESFKANILSYLSAPEFNWLYKSSSILAHKEAQLFGGFIIICFLIAAFYRAFGDRHFKKLSFSFVLIFISGSLLAATALKIDSISGILLYLATVIFVALLRTLGSYESKLGYEIITNRGIIAASLFAGFIFYFFTLGPLSNFGIYTLYYYIFPGAEAIRAIGRAGVVIYFLICITVPLTFHYLNKSGFLNNKILTGLLIFILAENWTSPYPLEEAPERSPVFKYLEELPAKNGSLIVLPFSAEPDPKWGVKSWGKFATYNTEYLYLTLSSGMHSVNGYSGQRSRLMYTLPAKLEHFPNEVSLEALSHISNLRYIVVDSGKIANFSSKHFSSKHFFENVFAQQSSLTYLLSDSENYHLFEFHPFNKITENFEIWMPSYPPAGKARLQLYFDNCEQENLTVPVFIKKFYENTPYAELSLSKEKGWESKEIILPVSSDKVAPTILIIKPDPSCSLYIKDREFLIANVS